LRDRKKKKGTHPPSIEPRLPRRWVSPLYLGVLLFLTSQPGRYRATSPSHHPSWTFTGELAPSGKEKNQKLLWYRKLSGEASSIQSSCSPAPPSFLPLTPQGPSDHKLALTGCLQHQPFSSRGLDQSINQQPQHFFSPSASLFTTLQTPSGVGPLNLTLATIRRRDTEWAA
jgi:hypothetical protein